MVNGHTSPLMAGDRVGTGLRRETTEAILLSTH